MKQFILILSILFCIVGCDCLKRQPRSEDGEKMKISTYVYDKWQVDSMCVRDTLTVDIEKWLKSSYIDYETGEETIKYVFIKHVNTKNETTYILVPMGVSYYQITKRVIVE